MSSSTVLALLLTVPLLAIARFARAEPAPVPSRAPSAAPVLGPDWFPAAREGLRIETGERATTCDTLVRDLERVTGVHVIAAADARVLLAKLPTGLMAPLDVTPAQVWSVVESVLSFNEFVLGVVSRDEPRVFSIQSLQGQGRTNLRNAAIFVKQEELGPWAKHPCFLVSTMLDLDATDVRTLSNSMRQLFTDANTQQLVPVGNGNTILLTGFGPNVVAVAELLSRVNELERKRLAEEAKKPPTPPPAPAPAAK